MYKYFRFWQLPLIEEKTLNDTSRYVYRKMLHTLFVCLENWLLNAFVIEFGLYNRDLIAFIWYAHHYYHTGDLFHLRAGESCGLRWKLGG